MTQNPTDSFSYVYNGQTIETQVRHFLAGTINRYYVRVGDTDVTLVRTEFKTPDGRPIWTQSNRPGEYVQPHGLMQAIGEGIDKLAED